MSRSRLISHITVTYFVIGFVFAIIFAVYYHWSPLSFLSPGFYSVILTWPYQAIGFVRDFWNYGIAGKSI